MSTDAPPSQTSEGLRARVERHLGSLTPVGRRVALVLLDQHDHLGFHSATELARMAGTSDATVVRTIQRLGYRGIIHLKTDVARRLTPATPAQRMRSSMGASDGTSGGGDLLDGQLRALSRLDSPEIRHGVLDAAAALARASRVQVSARGISVGIATHAAAQLARVGIDARMLGSAAGITGDDLVAVRPGDALLMIASGTTQAWQEALYARCCEIDGSVVLVTDTHPAPPGRSVVIRASRGDPRGIATHVPTIAVVEAITWQIASLESERAHASLAELSRQRALLR